jgi:hypothetical protein
MVRGHGTMLYTIVHLRAGYGGARRTPCCSIRPLNSNDAMPPSTAKRLFIWALQVLPIRLALPVLTLLLPRTSGYWVHFISLFLWTCGVFCWVHGAARHQRPFGLVGCLQKELGTYKSHYFLGLLSCPQTTFEIVRGWWERATGMEGCAWNQGWRCFRRQILIEGSG